MQRHVIARYSKAKIVFVISIVMAVSIAAVVAIIYGKNPRMNDVLEIKIATTSTIMVVATIAVFSKAYRSVAVGILGDGVALYICDGKLFYPGPRAVSVNINDIKYIELPEKGQKSSIAIKTDRGGFDISIAYVAESPAQIMRNLEQCGASMPIGSRSESGT